MLEKGIACESGFPLSNQAGKERVEKQTRIKEGYFVLNQTLMGNSPASEKAVRGLRFNASKHGHVWEWPGNEQPLSWAQGVRQALYIVTSISKRDGRRAEMTKHTKGPSFPPTSPATNGEIMWRLTKKNVEILIGDSLPSLPPIIN